MTQPTKAGQKAKGGGRIARGSSQATQADRPARPATRPPGGPPRLGKLTTKKPGTIRTGGPGGEAGPVSGGPPPRRTIGTTAPSAWVDKPIGYGDSVSVEDAPNYEKLTASEKWLTNFLPGITSAKNPLNAGETVGEALEKFNASPVGKVLGWLDVGAEAAERLVGLGWQAIQANQAGPEAKAQFDKDWKAAWYAGSSAYDVAPLGIDFQNPFTFEEMEGGAPKELQDVPGAVLGDIARRIPVRFWFDHDAPGTDALIASRKRIRELVAGGLSYSEANQAAREEMYNSQGALALRMQTRDAIGHMVLDPINLLGEFFKPIEFLQARRLKILSTAIKEEGVLEAAAAVTRLEGTAQAVADLSKLDAGALIKAAGDLPDPDDAARLAKAIEEAQAAGDLAKVGELGGEVQKAAKVGLEAAEEQLRLAQKFKLTRGQQFVIWATGGLDVNKTGWQKWNPFALTPAAKAQEYVGIIRENINSRLLPNAILPDGTFDINKVARSIQRAADGTMSKELGHMIATLEGQHVRGVLQQIGQEVGGVARAYNAAGDFERPMAKIVSGALGDNLVNIVRRAEKGEHAAIFKEFVSKLSQVPDARKMFDALLASREMTPANFTPDMLRSLLLTFSGDGMAAADSTLAVAKIGDMIAEASMRQAVLRFGVQQRGLVEGMAHLLKQAETMAFLKLNPVYPVRNFINNVFTMFARGTLGGITPDFIKHFWKAEGFVPARLLEGIGPAGDLAADIARVGDAERIAILSGQLSPMVTGGDEAARILHEATSFKSGWVQKVSDRLGDINRNGWGFSQLSHKIERLSSENAMTTFYIRGKGMFGKVGGGIVQRVVDFNPKLANELGSDLAKQIQGIVEDAGLNPAKLDAAISSGADLNISGARLRSLVEKQFGRPVSNVIPDEFFEPFEQKMVDALRSRDTGKIDGVFDEMRDALDNHVAGMHDDALKTLSDEALARVKTEGPGAFAKVWGDSMDEWYGGIVRYDMDAAKTAEAIKQGVNPELSNIEWNKFMREGERYWGRQWDRLDARMSGMAKGAQEAGLKLQAGRVQQTFKQWRGDWQDFFKTREKMYSQFFEAKLKGETPKMEWDTITATLDEKYAKALANEDAYAKAIDEAVAVLLPDQQAEMFLAWRGRVNQLRRTDKEMVVAFRKKIRGLKPEQVQAEYAKHWQTRIQGQIALWQEERMGAAAMGGNPVAQQAYAQATQQAAGEPPIMARLRRAEAVKAGATPEEAARMKQLSQVEEVLPKDISKVPRDQLPEELSREIEYTAKRMSEELSMGEGPLSLRYTDVEGGAEVTRFQRTPSTNPDWFQEFGAEFGYTKKQVRDALDKVIADAGADVDKRGGQIIKRLKTYIKDEMMKPDPLTGEPPNQRVIEMLQAQTGPAAQAARADELRALEEGILARGAGAPQAPPRQSSFVPDSEVLFKPEMYAGTGLDQLVYTRGHEVLDMMKAEGMKMLDEPPLKWKNLTPDQQAGLQRYFETVKGSFADARYASTRFAEFGRDSALLNYNRRYNYNTWFGMVFPFEFWTTQSAFKWALHSIDRPGMLAAYYRIRKFMETAYNPREGLPSRLKGTFRLNLPFLPDWMQDQIFVDPIRVALPFDGWFGAAEQAERQMVSDEGKANRKLQELLNDGDITQQDYNQAIQTRQGEVWERAIALAEQDDQENRLDPFDFVGIMSAPHAPLVWAHNALRGREPIPGAVLPITNTLGSIYGALGIDPAGPLNPEAAIRKHYGLHPFNKWDDYYTERQLTNLVAEGVISAADARLAMVKHEGPAWEEAYRRTWTERSGGPVGAFLGLLGMPPKAYPEGEEYLRQSKDDYEAAWDEYNGIQDAYEAKLAEFGPNIQAVAEVYFKLEGEQKKAYYDAHPEIKAYLAYEKQFDQQYPEGVYQATIGKFVDDHPGYEERLALFDKPEDRLRKFISDEVWNTWNDLPKLTQDEIKEQLGDEFTEGFLYAESNNRKNVTPETLGVWLKLMGGENPGYIDTPYQRLLTLTDPQVAWSVDNFYKSREQMFPNYSELSMEFGAISKDARVNVAPSNYNALLQQYIQLPKGTGERSRFRQEHPEFSAYLDTDKPFTRSARSVWLDRHPEYRQYLNWRTDWMLRNPQAAMAITDKPPEGVEEAAQGPLGAPGFSKDEWRSQLGWPLLNLIEDFARDEPLPDVAREELEKYAERYGFSNAEALAEYIAASP